MSKKKNKGYAPKRKHNKPSYGGRIRNTIVHGQNSIYTYETPKGQYKKRCLYYDKNSQMCTNKKCHTSYCTTARNCTCYEEKEVTYKTLSDYDDTYIQLPDQAGTHERTNEYIAVSKAIGTPCHVGYMKNPGERRHKARCIYYDKSNKQCKYYKFKCIGSSRCEKYEERKID